MPLAVRQKLLKSNESFTTSLVVMLIDDFGTEALSWTPKAIIMELEEAYRCIPTQGSIDRLMAGVHLLTCNSFYTSLPDFNDLCGVLSGEPATPGVFQPADAASCAWGVTEAMLIAPPDDPDNAFTEDIRAFVGAVIKNEGILSPPDVLRIAHFDKDMLQKVRYDFSDDEEMFQGIYQAEQAKTAEINDFIQKRLRALVEQLMELHLKNGDISRIAQKMLASLPAPDQGGSPLPNL